jgi:hypothetical protein
MAALWKLGRVVLFTACPGRGCSDVSHSHFMTGHYSRIPMPPKYVTALTVSSVGKKEYVRCCMGKQPFFVTLAR